MLPARYVDRLPLEEVTIAEILKAKGYSTGFFGKWHLGGDAAHWPEHQGFDVNVGGWSRGSPMGGYFSPWENPRLESTHDDEYLTERLASECASFIERQDGPYFAMLSFYAVHTPLQGRPDLVERYREKKATRPETVWGVEGERKVRQSQDHAVYAAMVHAMDEAVGVVLDAIEARGEADETLVVFFSDNGGLSTSEGHPTSNLPLRAGKGWVYEGGIREPCVIRWPGVTTAGTTIDTPISSIDFLPTIASACGSSWPEVDGIDLRPVIEGDVPDRALFWHYPHYGNQGGSPAGAMREGRYKLIEWYEPGREVELFDLEADPGETTNLASELPERVESMLQRLQAWR
ncbi:MAG: sulfatase, partial [Phycisphaerales bacterium]|nr:sulfatase [Phycisphaerales bacterium]